MSSDPVGIQQELNRLHKRVAELEHVEEHLRQSEARYRAIAEEMPGLICCFLPGGEITYVNHAYCRYFDKNLDELVGQTFLSLIPEEDRTAVISSIEALTLDSPTLSQEHRVTAPGGEIRWHRWTNRGIFDVSGRIISYQSIGEDISEWKRVEKAHRENEEYLRSVFRAAPAGIGVVSHRVLKQVNTRMCEMTGYSEKELLGRNARMLYPSDEDFEYVGREKYAQISDHGTGTVETRWQRKDGKIIDVLLSSTPMDLENLARGVTFTALDITQRKRAAEERLSLERQVQHAQKLESLGVLAGGIAHDFNNLLMGILGNVDLALMNLAPEAPAMENLLAIETAGKRAADLAKQMLAYSGKGRFLIVHMDLQTLIEEMVHLLEVSIAKKSFIKYDFARNVPPIEADATQIRQIIMNLVVNASEAIGDRSGVISVRTGVMECDRAYLDETYLDDELKEGFFSYFEIADSGCGMDEETLNRIFDPFFTTKFTGRGLGLAAVLGIVRGHSGAIKVYSEPGKGTTFKVLFPTSRGAVIREDPNAPLEPDKRLLGKTALLVDDEESVRTVGRKMLNLLGMEAVTAEDGQQALLLFQETPDRFDIVILDLTMPHMDGEEAFREMRRVRKEVCVLLSSGYDEQDLTVRFASKGLAGFIQKPYQLKTLNAAIVKALALKQG